MVGVLYWAHEAHLGIKGAWWRSCNTSGTTLAIQLSENPVPKLKQGQTPVKANMFHQEGQRCNIRSFLESRLRDVNPCPFPSKRKDSFKKNCVRCTVLYLLVLCRMVLETPSATITQDYVWNMDHNLRAELAIYSSFPSWAHGGMCGSPPFCPQHSPVR